MSELPSNWRREKLENITNSITVGHVGSTSEFYRNEGVLFLRTGNLNSGKIALDDVRYVDRKFHESLKKSTLQKGDVLVSRVGYTGNAALVPENFPEANCANIIIIRPKSFVNPEYLHIFINSSVGTQQNASLTAGSAQAVLNTGAIKNLVAIIPTIEEQQKIAKILSTVDNLIEKTQTLIDKYTAIKQGMMADLFTRGIDMTTGDTPNSKGGKLRPSVEDAPELYKQTELGWVPKEWEVVELESIANVDRGKFTHRPRDDAKCYGGEHPFIQTGSVTKAKGRFITDYKQTLSEFGRSVSREFSAGTIAVTIAANIADTGILNIPMCFPDSIVGVNVDESKALIRFVEITIRRNKQRLDAIAPLSAQKNINLEDLRPLKLALPILSEQVEICKRYEANERLIHKETAYLEKLKKQKKGLMQDLLTGKIKVNCDE